MGSIASYADIYQLRPYYTDEYSDGKYDRIITLKRDRQKLEMMIRDYYRRYKAYADYMKSRNGDWNDYDGRNDMAGLGLAPGDSSESAGWYYLGETDTVEECKRTALKQDALYTRIVHYTPDNGYKGTWQNSCYASVPGAKTSTNSRFNSIGVTTADRTYWVDEAVFNSDAASVLPPPGVTSPGNYNGWTYLGRYPSAVADGEKTENGLHACKQLAKTPDKKISIQQNKTTRIDINGAAPGAATTDFNTVLYLDGTYPGENNLKGTCYARSGQQLNTNTVFLYRVNTEEYAVTDVTTDISSGTLVYNNSNQVASNALYLSKKDLQIKDITSGLLPGGKITIQSPDNPSNYQSWTITASASNPSASNYITVPVVNVNDKSYKFWNAPNKGNVVVTIGNEVQGATMSYQTRCTDSVNGAVGETDEGENSGPPILKSRMVKDLQERYEAIIAFKNRIDDKFKVVPDLSDKLANTLDEAVFDMQTRLEPQAHFYADKIKKLETSNATMDDSDSHIRLNTNRYIFVFYTVYALLFICGLIYLLKADDDAPAVKYVQIGLVGSFILWLAYHVTRYNL